MKNKLWQQAASPPAPITFGQSFSQRVSCRAQEYSLLQPGLERRTHHMKTYNVSLPLIGLISGTRAIAAGGLALLLADRLDSKQRRAAGWVLLAVGMVSTLPLAAMLFGQCEKPQATAA